MMYRNTADYFQPDFYRFSEDSIQLVKFVANQNNFQTKRVLDLCSGCGVVGIEFAKIYKGSIGQIDFCEYQPDFFYYLKKNIDIFLGDNVKGTIHQCSYTNMDAGQYDLIVCNPPYFRSCENKLSQKSEQKNRCRFFVDSHPVELIESIHRLLAAKGCAYLLFRLDDKSVNSWYMQIKKDFADRINFYELESVSGATIVKLDRVI